MPRYFKHLCHVVVFYCFIIFFSYESLEGPAEPNEPNDFTPFGIIFLILQLIALLGTPQTICNILGLTFYDTFPGKIDIDWKLAPTANGSTESATLNVTTNGLVDHLAPSDTNHKSNGSSNNSNGIQSDPKDQNHQLAIDIPPPPQALAPFINAFNTLPHLCFRIVTRGCFPELVNNNVRVNLLTCLEAGLTNFSIEVVTDIDINITSSDARVKQIVVPKDYVTSTKARFKARALQYALEPGSSSVRDDDYIVHLDEETIITNNVINGIINFALEGKHAFGQGLITYASIDIVNVITTLMDSFRVARDMASIRFTLAALHRPIFGIKGSFVVTKCSAEKDVSFDHGEDGSIAEDCYFSMIADKKGYTFDFIMGEMFEKSPFTMLDLIKQRKRWLQGIWLVVGSPKIPWKTKFFLAMTFYAWLTLPLTSLSLIGMITKVPYTYYIKPIIALTSSSTVYMYFFGLVKSFDLKERNVGVLLLYCIIQFLTISIVFIAENVVVIWGAFTNKHNFYIVEKEKRSTTTTTISKAPTGDAQIIARF